ncbi:hypothetical protein BEWA_035380 [Theileria equi strain WA]|uniref:Uncharacterized protein n=1 Tax=Theileria equi strain WA TaxID=1537102 RepID=L1LDH4_THEEQ|nr:hypothetical protein BEWA_035380 [Theileria equi strain WA]EKX73502.1 hypothetical protein BEWA_035380 [Theileria equi strain WA]|eukprot:XP_004832954.1 hypothetical protein BEWA_035380 [Theileria equi strain WA]
MAVPQPGVIIDISQKPPDDGPYTYGGNGNQDVQLVRTEDPPDSGFFKFTHSPSSGGSGDTFHVEKVMSGATPVSELKQAENIEHLAVWYYSGDRHHNQPILIEIERKDTGYDYRETKGSSTEWNTAGSSQSQLKGEKLEQRLEYLNCKHNNALTANLTFQNSSTLSDKHHGGKNKYCCYYHNPGGVNDLGNITVEKVKIYCTGNHNSADCYKHEVDTSDGSTVAKIKYDITDGGGVRKRIKSDGLSFPVTGSVTVYVLYCDRNPALIYVKGTGQSKWYKKPNGSSNDISGDENWTDVTHTLEGATPKHFGKLERNQWNALVNVLRTFPGCRSLGTCPPPPKPPPAPLGPQGPPSGGSTSGSVADGLTTEPTQALPSGGARSEEGSKKLPSDVVAGGQESGTSLPASPQASVVSESAALADVASGGILAGSAGSGLTGFLGYRFYQSFKGNPWVGQI